MKNCDDVVKDFALPDGHCPSCHDDDQEGLENLEPILINGIRYSSVCCAVTSALTERNIDYEIL